MPITKMQATAETVESMPMPEVKEPKPTEKISNKFIRPDIERYPIYNALTIGFDALNGKTDSSNLTSRLQDLSANA